MGKWKFEHILEMANRWAKQGEIWDLGVLVEYVLGTFDFAAFKIIFGSFVALVIFQKYDFQNTACSTLVIIFSQFFIGVPCDSPHKRYFLEF